jgi:uncharacterized membrane protein YcaP (DUF421 family)
MDLDYFIASTLQTSFLFFALLIFARFLGKSQVGQLTFYEYISGITIGSIAGSIAASDDEKFFWHFYDLCLFVAFTFLVARLSLKSRRFRTLVEGEPTLLVSHGVIHKKNMRSVNFDLSQLIAELRLQGIADIRDAAYVFLETSGKLSIIKNTSSEPPSRADLKIPVQNASLPLEVILDGEVLLENLASRKLTQKWLEDELHARGIDDESRVFYAALDTDNQLILFLSD